MGRKLIVEVVGNSGNFENSMRRSSAASNRFEHDLGKTTRGALAGSGAFKAMGRSLAFASGGFLAFAGVSEFLTKSVSAAVSAEKATNALAVAQAHATRGAKVSKTETDGWALSQERFGVSAVDATQGLARLTIFAGSTRRAMKGYTAALEISKATGKDMNAVTLAVGKALAGQTGTLARYIGHIQKGTTAQELFTRISEKFGGQARANTSASEQFGAALQNTEELVGQGLLPTVNKYLESGRKWLDQMNRTGKLQKDSARAIHDVVGVLKFFVGIVKTADEVTGSFKHTVELLLALKFVSTMAKWSVAMEAFATSTAVGAATSGIGKLTLGLRTLAAANFAGLAIRFPGLADNLLKVTRLSFLLKSLGTIGAIAIGIAITYEITTKILGKGGRSFFEKQGANAASDKDSLIGRLFGGPSGTNAGGARNDILKAITQARNDFQRGGSTVQAITHAIQTGPGAGLSSQEIDTIIRVAQAQAAKNGAAGGAAVESAAKAAFGKGFEQALRDGGKEPVVIHGGLNISVKLSNTFFDNSIARILLRGGLGGIDKQIAALELADTKIKARIAKTKDVTRQQNLEDELLQNEAQIRGLRATKVQNALQAADKRRQAAIDAANKRRDARNSKQFRQLGLNANGDPVIPQAPRLRSELGQIKDQVKGTVLDTPVLEAFFKRAKKVLSEPLIGREVRAKIQDTLNGIKKDLDKFNDQDLTRFRHESAQNFVKRFEAATGISLSPDQIKNARGLFDERGHGGTVAGGSVAFAGSGTIVIHHTTTLDGKTVAKNVTQHQVRHSRKRSVPRGI